MKLYSQDALKQLSINSALLALVLGLRYVESRVFADNDNWLYTATSVLSWVVMTYFLAVIVLRRKSRTKAE